MRKRAKEIRPDATATAVAVAAAATWSLNALITGRTKFAEKVVSNG